eukprot:2855996-Alexandrium_andersonii.AAC.1
MAQPGPSGARNSDMALLLEAPQGPQAYAERARQLARGAVAPGLLELLLRAIAAPLRKASGGARPIILREATLKGPLRDLVAEGPLEAHGPALSAPAGRRVGRGARQ